METDYTAWQIRSTSLAKFAPAFLDLQSELEPVKKDANNPFFKSKYAELSSILEAVQPLLTKHKFILIQEPGNLGEKLALTTTIMHISGEYIRSTVAFPVVKADPQGYGSAITYARRYSLQSILGLPVIDDDGAHASGTTVNNRQGGTNYSKPSPIPRPAEKITPQPKISTVWDGSELTTGGKYPKTPWKKLPAEYLEYLRHNAKPDNQKKAELEINRREEAEYAVHEKINQEAAKAQDDFDKDEINV